MAKMTEKETAIAGCVTMLAETFGRKASPGLFKAYELGLADLSAGQVTWAATQALTKCRFMPPPAELREMLFVKTEDRAVKAWLAFERAVVHHGYLRSVTFDDVVINATVRALGGWEACCGMDANQFDTFLQKRFQETYCALCRGGVSAEQALPLLGWADKQNGLNGFEQQPAIVIDTGMPALPHAVRAPRPAIQQSQRADVPRLELQKP
jgi:hypothetical protein